LDRNSKEYFDLVSDVHKYPNLNIQWKSDKLYVIGNYQFSREYKQLVCSDEFLLEIEIPSDFSNTLPTVNEVGNKIPRDYHKNSSTSLCLGTNIELYEIFGKEKTFSGFMEYIVNPYLYRWFYISKFNKAPWNDRAHGCQGIIDSYADFLSIPNDKKIISDFLFILSSGNARLNKFCPCGSGKKTKLCHMHGLNKLIHDYPLSIFQKDYENVRFL
jgi:hypothetical protein